MSLLKLLSADVCQAIDLHGPLLEPQAADLASHISGKDEQPGLQVLGCIQFAVVGSPGGKDGRRVTLQACNAGYERKQNGSVRVKSRPL